MLGVVGLLVATTLVPSGCGDPDPDGPASESGQYAAAAVISGDWWTSSPPTQPCPA